MSQNDKENKMDKVKLIKCEFDKVGMPKAKIQAKNYDEALSYFKGRFGMAGKLVKTNKAQTIFIIKTIN